MARRIIIGEILDLIKGLGGNPNKFMGTKSNITFLGKGPKEALFQGEIDIDGLMRFKISPIIIRLAIVFYLITPCNFFLFVIFGVFY